MKTQWAANIAMGVTAFLVYLLMRRYVLSDRIETQDYIIAGAIAVGLIIGQMITNRKRK